MYEDSHTRRLRALQARHEAELHTPARVIAAERRKADLLLAGWSLQTVRAQTGSHVLAGLVSAYEDSQHPPGVEPPYSNKQAGRKRKKDKPRPWWVTPTAG